MKNIPEQEASVDAAKDRAIAESYKNIKGWGVDADPENDPTYPMKNWNGADHLRFNYEKPVQQPLTVEILHSTERPGVSRVFGTTVPPSGVSGALRRFAFKFSESTYSHWLPLMLADRINVIEGYIDDYKKGEFQNPMAARWKAEWKYNKKGVLKTAAVVTVATTFVVIFLMRKKKWMGAVKTAAAGVAATGAAAVKRAEGFALKIPGVIDPIISAVKERTFSK